MPQLMYQLYLFLLAVGLAAAILVRRHFLSRKEAEKEFKEKVATKVEENRQKEKEEPKTRFKEELAKKRRRKSTDLKRYKEEVAQAEVAISRGQWNEAKRHLIQSIALTDDDLTPSLKLAFVYTESGEPQKAETLYRRLMEEYPDMPDIYESLAKIMVKKKQYKEAIGLYVRAVELDEKDDQKFLALGKLYSLMMRYSVAAECFRRAAELKPRDVEILFLLAQSCKLDEDFENALLAYERILTLEPYNEKAKDEGAEVRLKMKEYERF